MSWTKEEATAELKTLSSLPTPELRLRWIQVFKRPVPPKAQREFILGSLAYEIQVRAFDGLQPATLKRLRLHASQSGATGALDLRPGTKVMRTWNGEMHEVLALEQGFLYRDQTYRSLTEIASAITGAKWSGPLFFGLRQAKRKSVQGK